MSFTNFIRELDKQLNKKTVYAVYGLGFGDDENQWELCEPLHETRESAEAMRAAIIADGCPEDGVKVEPLEM